MKIIGSNPMGRRAFCAPCWENCDTIKIAGYFVWWSHLVNNPFQKHLSIVKQLYIRYHLSTTINYDLIVLKLLTIFNFWALLCMNPIVIMTSIYVCPCVSCQEHIFSPLCIINTSPTDIFFIWRGGGGGGKDIVE